MNISRRSFIRQTATAAATLPLCRLAIANPPLVAETDITAEALGYRADATKIDKAKYPRYTAGQACGNCTFYQGKAADASAPCPMFGGKKVAGKGWCSAYSKRT